MERIENIAYYLINKSIDTAIANGNNEAYLLDYDKLMGIIMMAQSAYLKLCSTSLVTEDVYSTNVGLRIKSEEERYIHSNNNANDELRMKLLPFMSSKTDRQVYDRKCYEVSLDMKAKVILDDIYIRFGSLSAEDFKKYTDIIFKKDKNNQPNYLISKEELAEHILPTGSDTIKQINDQFGGLKF